MNDQAQVAHAKPQFVQTKDQAIATAKSATDKAEDAAAGTAFVLVLTLLIGAAASGFGATAATRHRVR